MNEERKILAVFIDFENLAMGLQGRKDKFSIDLVLDRLVEKGNIVVKRAYADWQRFSAYSGGLHEAAIELIEIPRRFMTGKNSADMRLCVDAMDMCYSKQHINTFVILSGDSDFSPLVSKLKENGKVVIGLGMKESTSELLRDNCDEFIYYEDLTRDAEAKQQAELEGVDKKEKEVFGLLLESLEALRRENRDKLWPSLIKETMKRKKPFFNEVYFGYNSFGKLLDAAAARGLVELAHDPSSGTSIVVRFGAELGEHCGGYHFHTSPAAAPTNGPDHSETVTNTTKANPPENGTKPVVASGADGNTNKQTKKAKPVRPNVASEKPKKAISKETAKSASARTKSSTKMTATKTAAEIQRASTAKSQKTKVPQAGKKVSANKVAPSDSSETVPHGAPETTSKTASETKIAKPARARRSRKRVRQSAPSPSVAPQLLEDAEPVT